MLNQASLPHRQQGVALVAVMVSLTTAVAQKCAAAACLSFAHLCQTGFDLKYQQRRAHARQTWFPATEQELERCGVRGCLSQVYVASSAANERSRGLDLTCCRLYQKTGMILRFAIGDVPSEHEAAIAEEEKACGSFLRIPIEKVGICSVSLAAQSLCEHIGTFQSIDPVPLCGCRTPTRDLLSRLLPFGSM